jgi:hypothetical protein
MAAENLSDKRECLEAIARAESLLISAGNALVLAVEALERFPAYHDDIAHALRSSRQKLYALRGDVSEASDLAVTKLRDRRVSDG